MGLPSSAPSAALLTGNKVPISPGKTSVTGTGCETGNAWELGIGGRGRKMELLSGMPCCSLRTWRYGRKEAGGGTGSVVRRYGRKKDGEDSGEDSGEGVLLVCKEEGESTEEWKKVRIVGKEC